MLAVPVLLLLVLVDRAAATSSVTNLVAPCESDLECVDPAGCASTYCNFGNGYCEYADSWSFDECSSSGCLPRKCIGGPRESRGCIRQEDCPESECHGFQCIGGLQDGLACLPFEMTSLTSFSTTGPWSVDQLWVYSACEYSGGTCTGSVCYYGGELQLVNCLDATVCTADTCNASLLMPERCSHVELPCDDGNDCNGREHCDPLLGCQSGVAFSPANCDDGVACSLDICNATSGRCEHDYSGCGNCSSDADCDDGQPLTMDYCVTGRCSLSGGPCSECLDCGENGGDCVLGGLSSCLHAPAFCPHTEPQHSNWLAVFMLAGLLLLFVIWGLFAALQRVQAHRRPHHHEGDLWHRAKGELRASNQASRRLINMGYHTGHLKE